MFHIDNYASNLENNAQSSVTPFKYKFQILFDYLEKSADCEDLHDFDVEFAKFAFVYVLFTEPSDKALLVHVRHSASALARIDQDVDLIFSLETDPAFFERLIV
jgi:hypothetical protein